MNRLSVPSHPSVAGRGLWLATLLLLGACAAPEAAPEVTAQVAQGVEAAGSAEATAQTPVALALEVDDGTGIPLKLKTGQAYLHQPVGPARLAHGHQGRGAREGCTRRVTSPRCPGRA